MSIKKTQSRLHDSFSALLYRYEAVALLIGAAIGYLIAERHTSLLINSVNAAASLSFTLGPHAEAILTIVSMVGGAMTFFVLFRTANSFIKVTIPDSEEDKRDRSRDDYAYKLPPWPIVGRRLQVVLGEQHDPDGVYTKTPVWYKIGEMGMYGNFVAFGGIGSGKTQSVAYPILRQFFEYQTRNPELKFSGLIMDQKGNFTRRVVKMAGEYGRKSDILIVRPDGLYKWNPINCPDIEPEVLAGRLVAVGDNLKGERSETDARWVRDGSIKLLTHAIGLHRLSYGYVTVDDVNKLCVSTSLQDDEESTLSMLLSRYDARFEDINPTNRQREDYEYHRLFFDGEWRAEHQKHRGIILSEVTNITGLFSKPRIKETFCPTREKVDFPGFDQLISDGVIVCLGMTDSEYGTMANAIGILLKLEFQRAVLARVVRASRDENVNTQRPCLFMADEYQNFVSAGGKAGVEGDDNFYALSRESKCCSVVLSQSPVSIVSRVGRDTARVIFASLRNKVFLSIEDSEDAQMAADICGKDYGILENVSVNEQVIDANWDVISNTMEGKSSTVSENVQFNKNLMHIILPVKFSHLRTFESIVSGFNGQGRLPPSVVYLKPDFSLRSTPYNELARKISKEMSQ